MNLTPFVRPVTNSRVKQIERYVAGAEAIQRSVLKRLLAQAAGTEWGIRHNY